MTHTKGNWYSIKDTLTGVTYINCKIHDGAIIEIARICISAHDNSDHRKWTETLANAKLMAAAPELLKALETIKNAFWSEGEIGQYGVSFTDLQIRIDDLKSIANKGIKKATE